MSKREPRFDIDLDYGQQGEEYVDAGLRALFTGKCEVKRDAVSVETGNLFVEYECRHADGVWRKSGLATTEATLWAHVLGDTGVVLLFPVAGLKYACRKVWKDEDRRKTMMRGSHPTRGVLIPLGDVVMYAHELPFGEAA